MFKKRPSHTNLGLTISASHSEVLNTEDCISTVLTADTLNISRFKNETNLKLLRLKNPEEITEELYTTLNYSKKLFEKKVDVLTIHEMKLDSTFLETQYYTSWTQMTKEKI